MNDKGDKPAPPRGGLRQYLKYPVQAEDRFRWPKQKANDAVDWAADTAVDYGRRSLNAAGDFTKGVGTKIVSQTAARLNPMHALTALANPGDVWRTADQRMGQIMQPVDFIRRPFPFMREHFARNIGHYTDLIDGTEDRAHAGRAVKSHIQDKIAPVIGAGLITYGAFNIPSARANTRRMMDRAVPADSRHGKFARRFAPKVLLTTPIMRTLANPRLAGAMLLYGAFTGMGKRIQESREFAAMQPHQHAQLKRENRDMIAGPTRLARYQSQNSTRSQPAGTQAPHKIR